MTVGNYDLYKLHCVEMDVEDCYTKCQQNATLFLFTYLFIYLFTYLLTYLFIYLFIYSLLLIIEKLLFFFSVIFTYHYINRLCTSLKKR